MDKVFFLYIYFSYCRYNILSDKLKAVMKLVDNTSDPIEIHRNAEVMLDSKDEEIKIKDKVLKSFQYEVGQCISHFCEKINFLSTG